MKTTIEKINGVEHTVVWVQPYKRKTLEQTAQDGLTYWHDKGWTEHYYDYIKNPITNETLITAKQANHHIHAIALPPLPRNPTADDAKLLHLYASYGLQLCGTFYANVNKIGNQDFSSSSFLMYLLSVLKAGLVTNCKITHIIDEQDKKVEVAIL